MIPIVPTGRVGFGCMMSKPGLSLDHLKLPQLIVSLRQVWTRSGRSVEINLNPERLTYLPFPKNAFIAPMISSRSLISVATTLSFSPMEPRSSPRNWPEPQ